MGVKSQTEPITTSENFESVNFNEAGKTREDSRISKILHKPPQGNYNVIDVCIGAIHTINLLCYAQHLQRKFWLFTLYFN